MDPTAQLPAMVTALMFAALLAGYTQVIATRRKGRDDHRRYQERVRRNLEPEDLVALTVEAAAMARVPLAGTNWIPGT
jgi:methylamine---glutamate N-methyltransferase subunit C